MYTFPPNCVSNTIQPAVFEIDPKCCNKPLKKTLLYKYNYDGNKVGRFQSQNDKKFGDRHFHASLTDDQLFQSAFIKEQEWVNELDFM
jgi:hypothetical protein